MVTRASAKAKGRNLENALVEILNAYGLRAERIRQKGINDEGDVRAQGALEHCFECKNTVRLDLPCAMAEAQAEALNSGAHYPWVVHKRHGVGDPGNQWATTTTSTLAAMLQDWSHDKNELEYAHRRIKELEGKVQ